MLQDFSIGEHLLLVGNQGVGKNKLTDKLLQMLNRPREYIQLHRYYFNSIFKLENTYLILDISNRNSKSLSEFSSLGLRYKNIKLEELV